MIKSSIFTALSLLIFYNLYLFLTKDQENYYPQNITQDNLIKVQEYLYAENIPQKIIVGSSLAAKLDSDLLPDSFYNLAFRGQSIYDGFEIILSRKELPKQILIEYNNFLRSPQETSQSRHALKHKLTNFIKKNMPSQREKNQPVNRAILAIYSIVKHSENKSISSNASQDTDTTSSDVSMANIIIKEAVSLNQAPQQKVVEEKVSMLKEYVSLFKNKGVEIIFFEMPIDRSLCDSEHTLFIRKTIKKEFPEDSYKYINPDDCSKYYTKDGIHLVDESATKFTAYLMKHL